MRLKFGNTIWVLGGKLEFGEGTPTQDLWNLGYGVRLKKVLCFRFLEFKKQSN